MGIIIELLITMAFSAFFSGMEIAFVSSNKLRFEMEKSNNFSTKILTVFYNNPNNFISTMLVGNNIALVIYGILMAEIIENKLLSGLITNEALLVVIQTIISTFIILITGEFLPKTIFKINPNLTLKYLCIPTYICYLVLYPISKFSAMLSTSILTLTGKKIKKEDREKAFSKVDLDKIIVYRDNIDNIIGYIHSSEMFNTQDDWEQNIKSIPVIPESMGANKLMQLLMQQKKSLAVVVDEFGGTSGIIALEDLVEELLGDIEDEHDNKNTIAKTISENEYILSGRLEIEDINEKFGIGLPESDEYQTLGGLIINEYQRIPKPHENIVIDKFQFNIIKATNTKIELVKLKIQK